MQLYNKIYFYNSKKQILLTQLNWQYTNMAFLLWSIPWDQPLNWKVATVIPILFHTLVCIKKTHTQHQLILPDYSFHFKKLVEKFMEKLSTN